MAKVPRRQGLDPNSSHVRTALLAVCAFAALFILRHISSNSSKVKRMAEALQTCQHESHILTTPKTPDPFAAQTVYVPVACNDSASTSEQGSLISEAALKDMKDQIEKLQTTLSRKDELLRVRNNQLVEAYDTLEARAALWNQSVHSLDDGADVSPELLAVVAVASDYGQVGQRQAFRDAWYAAGNADRLQEMLGIRMVFVLGRNPVMVTDGTGVTHDTEEVAAEAKAHGDLLRVDALHKDGSDGRAQLMHDLWQVLPVKYSAYFYAKAQMSGLPSPVGFAQMLTQYDAREPTYAGCMKSGQVITDWKSPWYEPQNFKFGTNGGDHQYMLHAAATGYVISRPVALHLSRYSNILMVYANEDVMVGAWMLGLNVEHRFESGLCCSNVEHCSFDAAALTQAADATSDYLQRGGLPKDTGAGARRSLAGAGEANCALHSGACNGVCGLACKDDCDSDATWQKYRECVRTG